MTWPSCGSDWRQSRGRNDHGTYAPQGSHAESFKTSSITRPQRPGQLFFRYQRRAGQLAAGLVLGLRTPGPRAGPRGHLHRPGLQPALRPPAWQEPPLPGCEGTIVPRKKGKSKWKIAALALLLLLLLLGRCWHCGCGGRRLISPRPSNSPGHGRQARRLPSRCQSACFRQKDVTDEATAVVDDPQVAKIDRSGGLNPLTGEGTTDDRQFRTAAETAEVTGDRDTIAQARTSWSAWNCRPPARSTCRWAR